LFLLSVFFAPSKITINGEKFITGGGGGECIKMASFSTPTWAWQ